MSSSTNVQCERVALCIPLRVHHNACWRLEASSMQQQVHDTDADDCNSWTRPTTTMSSRWCVRALVDEGTVMSSSYRMLQAKRFEE